MPAFQDLRPPLALLVALLLPLTACDDASSSPVDTEIDPAVQANDLYDDEDDEDDDDDDEDEMRGPRIEFADLAIFLEFNSTDDDLGVQVFLDAEGWDRIQAEDPDGRKVLDFRAKKEFGDLGLTELRFESAEPSPAAVLGAIPPGEYEFRGRTVDGKRLWGEAELSHDLLAPPEFTPDDGDVVDAANTVIEWDPVPGAEAYEVIVEGEENDTEAFFLVGPDVNRLTIPAEFMEPGLEYKAEILAIGENGNKTITEHIFRTQP